MSVAKEILQRIEENSIQSFFNMEEGKAGRGLSTQGGYMRTIVPVSSISGSSTRKAIEVKLFDRRVCHRHLLWYLLFRGITVLEWFLLYQNLESQPRARMERSSACLWGVLSLSANTRKGLAEWTSTTKPIHKILKSHTVQAGSEIGVAGSLLEFVISELNLPQKGLPKDNLFATRIVELKYAKPRELSRIGVGYKDKGSIAPEALEPPLADPLPIKELVEIDFLDSLWREILGEFS